MEIRRNILLFRKLVQQLLPALLLLFVTVNVHAQPPVKSLVVKNGHIYITLSKSLPQASLDSFIVKYDLQELDLKTFLKTNRPDSLLKLGWQVQLNNGELLVLSKSMQPVEKINDPVEKIMFSLKTYLGLNGTANKEPMYGYNRFIRKYPFAVKDSLVTFFLRNNKKAGRVMLAGTFNNWNPDAFAMRQVDSGWIAVVKLGAGKHYYKFIVDGKWTIDTDNRIVENDGEGNDNSVYYKTNIVFALAGNTQAKKMMVAGSFNNWNPGEIALERTTYGWEKPVYLAPGTHTYRFIADGRWFADPANQERFPNEMNEYNSVKTVGDPYLFSLKGYTAAKKVILMGSFNQWRNFELPMKKTNSGWELPYVLGHGNYEYIYEVDGKKIADPATGKEWPNQVLVIAPNQTFRLKGYANAKAVYLAGDFNNWSPNSFAMKRVGDEWVIQQHLASGKHVYKFVVDGKWIVDPANKLREPNEFHEENSVIWMKE